MKSLETRSLWEFPKGKERNSAMALFVVLLLLTLAAFLTGCGNLPLQNDEEGFVFTADVHLEAEAPGQYHNLVVGDFYQYLIDEEVFKKVSGTKDFEKEYTRIGGIFTKHHDLPWPSLEEIWDLEKRVQEWNFLPVIQQAVAEDWPIEFFRRHAERYAAENPEYVVNMEVAVASYALCKSGLPGEVTPMDGNYMVGLIGSDSIGFAVGSVPGMVIASAAFTVTVALLSIWM